MNIRASNLPHSYVEEWNDTLITAIAVGAISLRQEQGPGSTRWEHHGWQGTRIIIGREALAAAIVDVINAAQPHGLVYLTTDGDRAFVTPTHHLPMLEIEK